MNGGKYDLRIITTRTISLHPGYYCFVCNYISDVWAYPLIYAKTRKKIITKWKYKLICYGVNFLMVVLFSAINGKSSSGGPYILWTWVFSTAGIEILKTRGILDGFQSFEYSKTVGYDAENTEDNEILDDIISTKEESFVEEKKPQIKFCRKCGFELIMGSEFCSRCGTAIAKECNI